MLNTIPVNNPDVNAAGAYYVFADAFGWTPEQVDRIEARQVQLMAEFLARDKSRKQEK